MHFYAEPSVGSKLCGDPTRLRQILVNLLSNAVKFTNSGMVKMMAVITKTTEDKATMLFEVKDSGIGMTPEQIKIIFDPFTQADSSVTRKFGGTGLGLAISKNFIKLMGGTLSVQSTVGLGSKFSFELEFDLISDEKIAESDLAGLMSAQTLGECKKPKFNGEVLVCEDNALNQQVVREHLSRVGLDVVIANNGKEGVALVEKRLKSAEKQFNLIFMDIHMPIMDGLEATAKILEMGVKTPIVALTANVMSDALDVYKTSGIRDTLGKPFTAKELWQCLIKYFVNESTSDLNNDDEMQIEDIQRIFVKDNQQTYQNIAQALQSGDVKAAYRLVHSLKSNAGYIKENRLKEITEKTETLLLQEDYNVKLVDGYIQLIKTELEAIFERLAPLGRD
jgi:CheY-like chemotaxis protein